MKQSIENYVSQNAVKNHARQAFFAWMAIFAVSLLWMISIISAPIAKSFGYDAFANSIYLFFSYLCHQMEWRSFYLDGHPLAVCARCFGFYGGFFSGIISFPLFRSISNASPFPRFWLFLAMIPMGVDWTLTFFGVWENTQYSRLITGGILGAACAFFIVPALVEISYL
ncbi:MAG: DUF2085 domain-containing protein, partial [Pyrinomonadaceae bacterium]